MILLLIICFCRDMRERNLNYKFCLAHKKMFHVSTYRISYSYFMISQSNIMIMKEKREKKKERRHDIDNFGQFSTFSISLSTITNIMKLLHNFTNSWDSQFSPLFRTFTLIKYNKNDKRRNTTWTRVTCIRSIKYQRQYRTMNKLLQ